jgi:hypothetical protein
MRQTDCIPINLNTKRSMGSICKGSTLDYCQGALMIADFQIINPADVVRSMAPKDF